MLLYFHEVTVQFVSLIIDLQLGRMVTYKVYVANEDIRVIFILKSKSKYSNAFEKRCVFISTRIENLNKFASCCVIM